MEDYYWKADFELAEYEDRQTRVRGAMTAAGIDLLLVINPVNMNWLIGFRGKSYQEFQMLFFPLEPGPLTVVTRLAETYEFRDQSLAEEVIGWGGREPEDPIDVFARVMREHGWLGRRVGLELPDYYLHPLQYEAHQGNPGRRARARCKPSRARPEAGQIARRDRLYPQIP